MRKKLSEELTEFPFVISRSADYCILLLFVYISLERIKAVSQKVSHSYQAIASLQRCIYC